MKPLSDATRRFLEDAEREEAPSPVDRARLWDAISAGVSSAGANGESSNANSGGNGGDLGLRGSLLDRAIPLRRVIAMMTLTLASGIVAGRALAPATTPGEPVNASLHPANPTASAAPSAAPTDFASTAPLSTPPSAQALPSVASPRTTRSAPVAVTTGSAGSPSDEVREIVRAKRALDEGRPADALHALEEHELAYPHGSLAEERDALRVIALCTLGRATEGSDERNRFLRAHPFSAYADRIRTACSR